MPRDGAGSPGDGAGIGIGDGADEGAGADAGVSEPAAIEIPAASISSSSGVLAEVIVDQLKAQPASRALSRLRNLARDAALGAQNLSSAPPFEVTSPPGRAGAAIGSGPRPTVPHVGGLRTAAVGCAGLSLTR